jgi:hypothetical protein
MRAGEVLALTLGDVMLDAGREALQVRGSKNCTERVIVLGPTATPKSLRGLRVQLRERRSEPAYTPLVGPALESERRVTCDARPRAASRSAGGCRGAKRHVGAEDQPALEVVALERKEPARHARNLCGVGLAGGKR